MLGRDLPTALLGQGRRIVMEAPLIGQGLQRQLLWQPNHQSKFFRELTFFMQTDAITDVRVREQEPRGKTSDGPHDDGAR